MKYSEEALIFECTGAELLGVLARPENPRAVGVIVVVGGPQYRVGSHRQFVLLSRHLAAAGYATFRFDYRGMGDSEGEKRDFLTVSADIACAIDAMQKLVPSMEKVALWGLCDGASASLLYCEATQDPRVDGLGLLNPWVRSQASLAKTQVKHYYTKRLRQKEFWAKLLSGKVASSAVTGLLRSFAQAFATSSAKAGAASNGPFQDRMAYAWNQFEGRILLVLSGNDYTAKEFQEFVASDAAWATAFTHPRLTRQDCASADHTFSERSDRVNAEALTLDWLISQADH